MRTKALFCAAVVAVASLIQTAQAQVYSVNVAGYVTMNLTNGYNLIANPLDFDGTGTNNSVYTVFSTNMPNLTQIASFWPPTGTYSNSTYLTATKRWGSPTNAVNLAMQPGKGFFIRIVAAGVTTTNVTMVGNVRQGALTNTFPVAQQILSSQVPQGGGISTTLGYTKANLDKVSQWDVGAQKFKSGSTVIAGNWSPSEPNVNVGESFFITTHATSKWTRNFTVQ